MDELLAHFTLDTILRDVLLPYLRELGERWARGEVSVAQEHYASGAPARAPARPRPRLGPGVGPTRSCWRARRASSTTSGLIAFGLAVRARGWRVTFLGQDTPVADVAETAKALRPELVVVGATTRRRLRVGRRRAALACRGGAARRGRRGRGRGDRRAGRRPAARGGSGLGGRRARPRPLGASGVVWPNMKVVVFGATGTVGRALLPRLEPHDVVAVSGQPREGASPGRRPMSSTPAGVRAAIEGAEVVYYLVHSLGESDFEERDARGAETVAREAERAGVRQLVYLGGLGDESPGALSPFAQPT